jgi:fatty-acyl-CoA synthase
MTIAPTIGHVPLTLDGFLRYAATVHPNGEIVSARPDGTLDRYGYRELWRRSRRLARALVGLGLEKGERVGTLMWNHQAHLEAHFGVPAAGGVLHPLNIRLHPGEIADLIEHAETRLFLVDDVLNLLYQEVSKKIAPHRVIFLSYGGQRTPQGHDDYETLLAANSEDAPLPPVDETDAALLCYTGGTTGRPKGVVYPHRALVLHSFAVALPNVFGISSADVVAAVAPLFHISSWTLPFTATLAGAKQVLPGAHTRADVLLDLFESEQVTFAAAVPTVWHGVLEALDAHPSWWKLSPRLRLMTGGAAPSETLIAGLRRHGVEVIQTWGMTETTASATVSRITSNLEKLSEDDKARTLAKQGIPVPFIEMRIVKNGSEVPWDGVTGGELQVHGPWVTRQYHRWSSGEDAFTEDGWLRTADVAAIEPSGCLKLLDRSRDLIKSGGEWISSIALENALMGHPAVAAAVVVAYPHPKWQERPMAFIIARPGTAPTDKELRGFLEPKFAKWWLPDTFEFVDDIPRTSAGKWDRAKLRAEIKEHLSASSSGPKKKTSRV